MAAVKADEQADKTPPSYAAIRAAKQMSVGPQPTNADDKVTDTDGLVLTTDEQLDAV